MNPILVTGSRALADTPEAKAWAIEVLQRELAGCTELWECGRPGTVDEWAVRVAEGLRPQPWRMSYYSNGTATAFRPSPQASKERWVVYSSFVEARLQLVELFKIMFPRGTVLALLAPWSKTHGTEYTIREARLRKLAVREFVCSKEFGPRATP